MGKIIKNFGLIEASDFDFSAEIPEFREQLYKKLLEHNRLHGAVPLSDADLLDLNAAGNLPPAKPHKS